MRQIEGAWTYSAGDLVTEMQCGHRAALRLAIGAGLLTVASEPDPTAELLGAHGVSHEERVLARLEAVHGPAARIDADARTADRLRTAAVATRDAIASGAPLIYQAAFFDGVFVGFADFLIRTPDGRYEPVDAKSARSAKPGALLQLAAYAEAVESLGAGRPELLHLELGDGRRESVVFRDVAPVLAEVRDRLRARLAAGPSAPDPSWGEPRPACAACEFAAHCDSGREQARHLSLVAGVRSDQRRKLADAGVATIDALAAAADADRPAALPVSTFEKLRAQAALQCRQDATRTSQDPDGQVLAEVIGPDGFDLLPVPDPGDLFFDMEGDPFAAEFRGLEYLFGVTRVDTGAPLFEPFWADDPVQEKQEFEKFIDFVMRRWRAHPGMHVYHYASYERTALTRLSQVHGTREAEVDDMLRAGLLVDLYRVVQRSIRVSQRSYSLKKLEPLYMPAREEAVTNAADSIVAYERYAALRAEGRHAEAAEVRAEITEYNERDCESTWRLRTWLLEQAAALAPAVSDGDEPAPSAPPAPADRKPSDLETAGEILVGQLTGGLPPDPADRSPDQEALAVLAAAVGYHRREDKPVWWEHFARLDADPAEWALDDAVAVVTGIDDARIETGARGGRRLSATLRIEPSPTLRRDQLSGSVFLIHEPPEPGGDPAATTRWWSQGTATPNDEMTAIAIETRLPRAAEPAGPVAAVAAGPPPSTLPLQRAIQSVAETVIGAASWPAGPVFDILRRRPPAIPGGLPRTGDDVADVTAALRGGAHGYVAVQGPPGTGKTWLGSQVIAALAAEGWRIGVVAQSHKVIEHLLDESITAGVPADRVGKPLKPGQDQDGAHPYRRADVPGWLAGLGEEGALIGGTAWDWTGKRLAEVGPVDLLVIDEAGQFSLADTIAVSIAADRLLLLGDPNQLPQVSQGSHPAPADASALGWLIGSERVLPADFGYFRPESFRMHPAVCEVVSQLAYDGRLQSGAVAAARTIDGIAPGVHPVPVPHLLNVAASPEEAAAVVTLIEDLIGRSCSDKGRQHPLTEDDVLVVAPYNAQVTLLRRTLSAAGLPGVRVGTVDKFQGQQAPAVVVSMATSSAEEIPRGLEFLFSRNRLNVAVSRAQVAAFVVHSPVLRETTPGTADELVRLAGFLRTVAAGGSRDSVAAV